MAEEERDKQSMGTKLPVPSGGFGFGYSLRSPGNGAGWFGPLAPMSPAAPPEVKGRILDFASGYNLQQRARAYEPISFAQLRAFADSYDLLRLIIETRKDQLGKLRWGVVAREHAKKKTEELTPQIEEIEKFFIRPDKDHFWDEWLRMILEDLFVLDAPAIYRRRTMGGDLYALQPIDGGTIKRVIDDYGNTPEAPNPAYQQILKGLAAVDYTTEDLIYRPRNIRTHKVYGYSPVEQVIMTINIALRRQVWQLQSFTEGNIPEALIGVPGTWTPDQVRQFQDWFDSQLQGNTGERRRARFVPGEIAKSYVATKTDELFGAAEEWLARVICFAFSISPQPFVKMMNRATAETASMQAREEGLAPIQNYIKNLVDTVIIEDFKNEDLEFAWLEEDELDPNVKSQILERDAASGRITINEARIEQGLDPYPEPEFDRPMLKTASGWVPVALTPEEKAAKEAAAAAIAGAVPGQPGAKPGDGPPGADDHDPHETADDEAERSTTADQEVAEKSARPFVRGEHCTSLPVADLGKSDTAEAHGKTFVNPDRTAAKKVEKKLRGTIKAALALLGQSVSKQIAAKLKGLGKADDDGINIDEILSGLTIMFDEELEGDLAAELASVYESAGKAGLAQLGVNVGSDLVNQVSDRSVEWAEGHAADLVGRSEASFISDATRDMLRVTITAGIEDNLSAEDIASGIEEAYAFSEERASLIAMTEVATANSQGALAGYEEAQRDGISVKKSWLILEDACDDCQENEDAGPIELDDQFPSGDDAPPAHPNCRCVLVPEVEDGGDMTAEEADDAEQDVASEG